MGKFSADLREAAEQQVNPLVAGHRADAEEYELGVQNRDPAADVITDIRHRVKRRGVHAMRNNENLVPIKASPVKSLGRPL